MTTRGLQTEFNFTLPLGYVDESGTLHKSGTMRLATAADEILPLRDPRVGANQAYLVIILLSRVVTRLGALEHLNPKVVEGLFAGDLAQRVAYDCQQFYGGMGYIEETNIARAWRDIRLITIGGGTSEIMKEIISKASGL